MSQDELLRAIDAAIAEVERAEAEGIRMSGGVSAARQLAELRHALRDARAAAAEHGTVNPDWLRSIIRNAADWVPDTRLRIIAALGAIARAAGKE